MRFVEAACLAVDSHVAQASADAQHISILPLLVVPLHPSMSRVSSYTVYVNGCVPCDNTNWQTKDFNFVSQWYLGVAAPQPALPLPNQPRADGGSHGSRGVQAVCPVQAAP